MLSGAKKLSFKVDGNTVEYTAFTGSSHPSESSVGDLYTSSTGEVYVKHEGEWVLGEDEVSTHPVHGEGGILAVKSRGGCRWVVPGTIRGRKSKAKEGGKRDRTSEEGERWLFNPVSSSENFIF